MSSFFRSLTKYWANPPETKAEATANLRESMRQWATAHPQDQDSIWMMDGVLNVAEMQVRDIMVPRAQMVVLEADSEQATLLRMVVEAGHSRYPVIGETRDEVLGILLAKDLLKIAVDKGFADTHSVDLKTLLRPAVLVPESKRLNILLKEFRAQRNHMAIVIDEYGGVAGLVTIEDVLEQIVGEIDDEHDEAEGANIVPTDLAAQRYLVKALTSIEEFNEYFHADLSDEEADTIGGLTMTTLEHMPKRGEKLRLGKFELTVLRADSRRLHQLQVVVCDNADNDN